MKILLLLVALTGVNCAHHATSPGPPRDPELPPAGAALVSRVRELAAAKNLTALRDLMIPDFTWSFGAEESRDGALTAWREEKQYLPALTRVLGMPCRIAQYNDLPGIECPGDGGETFRAWFAQADGGWKFVAFVEGD